MHATEFFKQPSAEVPPVCVLWGGQRHLKHSALSILKKIVIDDDETSLTRFAGSTTDLQSVTDELRTISMWSDRRLIVVEDADEFITSFRSGLEKYLEKPARKSVLVLDVKTWTKSTRLAKAVAATGLEIECSPLKGMQLSKWLQETAREQYGQSLSRDASSLLIELVGDELGLLDQELSKLASYVGTGGTIEAKDVQSLVGGWKTETTWAMTDAVRDGNLDAAVIALDQLLMAGEPGPKLLGGISFVFKKLAVATELAKTRTLDHSLKEAGVFPMSIGPSAAYLKRIGRPRAERILSLLVEAESGLKGGSRLPERIQLETLLLKLAGK